MPTAAEPVVVASEPAAAPVATKPEIVAAGVIDRAPGGGSDEDILGDLGGEGSEEAGEQESESAGEPDSSGGSDGSDSSGEQESEPADEPDAEADPEAEADAEPALFDQAAFDARMAELAGVAAPAAAEAPAEEPVAAAPATGLVGEFRAKLTALKESAKYESDIPIIDFIGETIEPMLERFSQVESMYVRQVAQGVAMQLQEGAALVAKTYGIQIAPEQMDSLLRRNTDLAQKAGGFTSAVVLEAFERENWKSLMAMQQAKGRQVTAKPSPKTLPAAGGADRMHRQGQKLSDDELILRDLG